MFRTKVKTEFPRVQIGFYDEDGEQAIGRTEQHHATECDIHNILRRYEQTGLVTHVNKAVAHYGDFSKVKSYSESLMMIKEAEASFLELPSEIRKYFDNDAGVFLEFAQDPKNSETMVELGLAEPKPQKKSSASQKSKKEEVPAASEPEND